MSDTETICALATPSGNASVAIIRLTGARSLAIAQQVTKKTLTPRYAHFTTFYNENDQVLDQGITLYFPAPYSFTGEQVVELHPHGNPYVCQQIIHTLLQLGARLALAGEFSERAFLNGKLDLVQLEAIADLISSSSQQAARSAVQSMQGKFSQKIADILNQLIQIRTHIEASLDFAEEDIETETRQTVQHNLAQVKEQVHDIFAIAQQGAQLHKGYTLVLTGSPNVGKSSLFNALCAEDRAIVTSMPGTTRDVVCVDVNLEGIPIRLMDTAGIREDAEIIEQEGIARARSAIESADLVIHMLDACQLKTNTNISALQNNEILVINKIDLINDDTLYPQHSTCISVKTGQGLDDLYQRIRDELNIFPADQQAPFSARARHLQSLERCLNQFALAQQQLQSEAPLELAAEELRLAQQELSTITGEFTPDDLLDYVFREFCIGK